MDNERGHRTSFELPLGYDWVEPRDWRTDEVFYGKYAVPMPSELLRGAYRFGLVVLGPDGVRAAQSEPSAGGPWFAAGEVSWPDGVEVVTVTELSQLAKDDRNAAFAATKRSHCEKAEHFWWLASSHRVGDGRWHAQWTPEVNHELSKCWVRRANLARDDQDAAVGHLERARGFDPSGEMILRAGARLGERMYQQGLAAREAGDHEAAYRIFSDVLRVDPSRSWARRYAEEARAVRLSIQ
jgi:tetratricopeptide (TPR) repeat protein